MSQREGVIRFYKQYFNDIKCSAQKSGTIGQLIYSVRLPHGLPLEINYRSLCCSHENSYRQLQNQLEKKLVLALFQVLCGIRHKETDVYTCPLVPLN